MHGAESQVQGPLLQAPRNGTEPRRRVECYETAVQLCSRYIEESIRAIRLWSPEFIPLSCPFMVCAIPGPFGILFGTRRQVNGKTDSEARRRLDTQMLELVIGRFAEWWNLASLYRGKAPRGFSCLKRI